MASSKNIVGAHMEGPYLNPKYGAHCADSCVVDAEKYRQYIASGIVKQWTSAPEVEGVMDVISELCENGIVPAIGHSAASPDEVKEAQRRGARIVTHLFDATGASVSPTRYAGTVETSFDAAALVCHNLYYEIICDSKGIHVRPDMVRLAIKTAGIDKIIAVTDCCTGGIEDGSDVNILDGELIGSRMTMDQAAKNFYALGLTVPEVFRVTSANPAYAIGLGYAGVLHEGKRGDLLILDNELNLEKVYKA
jgi:N-acetylglucosamine-6-phosphate deacetylase